MISSSVDPAFVTRAINDGAAMEIATIQPQDFVFDGCYRTATLTDDVSVPSGTTELTYCFTQSGAQGRESKKTCTTVTLTVDCSGVEATCDKAQLLFGNVVNNPVLCNGSGPSAIPVHFSGKAKGPMGLNVTGPNGFDLSAPMARSGDSCIYQYLWDLRTAGNGGLGAYTFTASDDTGPLATVERKLSCR